MTAFDALFEKDINKLCYEYNNECVETKYNRPEHEEFAKRIRKTLYYGKLPANDRPSLPMTELAVNYIRDAAPKEFGKIDMYLASDVGRKAYVSPCSMMLGMIYVERLKHKNPEYLDRVSSSDLFLISMMVASKYLYDEGIDEEVFVGDWADSCGLEAEEVNQLERDFLNAIEWSLFTQAEDFEKLLQSVEERIGLTEGLRRGYWSYSDVWVFFRNENSLNCLRNLIKEFNKVIIVCSAAYTACVLTMLASVATVSLLRANSPVTMDSLNLIDATTSMDLTRLTNGLPTTSSNANATLMDDESDDDVTAAPDIDDDLFVLNYLSATVVTYSDLEKNESVSHPGDLDMDQSKGNRRLTLPGLLTLTFMQDTVTQFLSALSDDTPSSGHGNSDSDDCLWDSVRCRCPNCPAKATKKSNEHTRNTDQHRHSLSSGSHDLERSQRLLNRHRFGAAQNNDGNDLEAPADTVRYFDDGGSDNDYYEEHTCSTSLTNHERGHISVTPRCLPSHVALDVPLRSHTMTSQFVYS